MSTISIEEFMKVNLMVSEVKDAEPVPDTNKLMKLTVFDGNSDRSIVAGVAGQYNPEDLIGKKIVTVANLQPATIRGVESNGMLLAADVHGSPRVIFLPDDVPTGSRVR